MKKRHTPEQIVRKLRQAEASWPLELRSRRSPGNSASARLPSTAGETTMAG